MRTAIETWTQAIGVAGVVFLVSAGAAVKTIAQAPAGAGSSGGGIYTEDQAKRGEAVSNKFCTSCHGPELSGGEAGPTLVGLEFLGNWNSLTAGDFYDRVHSTMPADAPGTLTPQQTSDVMAYVFKLNKFPAGTSELPIDLAALKGIKIEQPK
jgi:ubiquinol-cytochrome c reductase cytochrome c subunit